jgi:ATP-binding cassette subfamily B protein
MAHWHGGGFTGSIREEDTLGKAYDSRLMKRLLRYIYPYKRYVIGAIILMSLGSICGLAGPYLIKVAIDGPIKGSVGVENPAPFVEYLFYIIAAFVCIIALQFIIMYNQTILIRHMSLKVMHRMRTEIFNHLQTLSLSFFDNNPVGRLVTRVTSDVEALNELFTSGIIALISDFFRIFAIVIIMSLISPKMTLVCMIIIPPLFVIAHFYRKKARVAFRNIRMKIARVNAFVGETVTGMRVIQIFTQEERSGRRFNEINSEHLDENLKAVKYQSFFYPGVEILAGIGRAAVIWFGALFVLGRTLTPGEFVFFWLLVRRFFQPIIDLSDKYSILQSAMAASERIFKLLDTKPGIENPPAPVQLPAPKGRIDFQNVSFSYEPGPEPAPSTYVLKDINFSVEPGESVALVGATGAGKTSIISLLTRLYDVKRGRILVDGTDIRNLDKHTLRRHIGTVMQDVFLFSGDIRHNITLGDELISDEQLEGACSLVNANRFIERLPAGFDSPVAERGVTFSAGERQLLSFARAVAREPAIIVLDEATSSVDTETEQVIQQGLFRLMEGRTCIIVAHRLSTIKHVDRIIVLHHGEIREVGSHQQLLARGGIYRKLYELQYKSQEVKTAPGPPPETAD